MFPRQAIILLFGVILLAGCVAPLQVITPTHLEETATPKPTKSPTATPSPVLTPQPTATKEPLRPVALAAHVADVENLPLLREMGGDFFIATLHWSDVEREDVTPTSGPPYIWDTLNPLLRAAVSKNMNLILRVDGPPDWAWRGDNPPLDMAAFADFMGDVSHDYGNRIFAYVIWNEPNLPSSWGGRTPNPSWYAQMLQAVYPRIKKWNPDAIVVAAGMATVGGDGCPEGEFAAPEPGAVSDLAFLQGLYENGAQGFFDVLGTHPYGFAYPPGIDPCKVNGQAFRRAEQQRAIMEAYGDGAKLMWALEFGWLLRPPAECETDPSWQGLLWQAVDEETQARYLTRAVRYAAKNWLWMELMAVFNFDFAAVPTYEHCHAFRWWSLAYRRNPQNLETPIRLRPGFSALQDIY